jgi:hypothetical protein
VDAIGPEDSTVPGPGPHEHLADRLTEEVVQLLYVVRQDLQELGAENPELASDARCRTSQAIAGLFAVAEELRGCPAGVPRRAGHEAVRLRALAGRTPAQIRIDDALALRRRARAAAGRDDAHADPSPRGRREPRRSTRSGAAPASSRTPAA